MSAPLTQILDRMLTRKEQLASLVASNPQTASRLQELRRWQATRVAHTYRDLRQDPRCASAIEFFLSDLYGESPFAARDRVVSRALPYLKHWLPPIALQALARAIELELLTVELDHAMVAVLPPGDLDEELYAAAYRSVGRREARHRQIDLVVGAGEDLERIVRHAWVGLLLRAAHAPLHAAGFGALQDFLERGFESFRQMGSAQKMSDTIRERETRLIEAILAGASVPART